MQDFIKIHEKDNVIVALRTLAAGTEINLCDGAAGNGRASGTDPVAATDRAAENAPIAAPDQAVGNAGTKITVRTEIPAGHKMAICEIPAGSDVIKYGCRIGYAAKTINCGDWVHTHNVKTALGDLLEYTYEPAQMSHMPKESAESQGSNAKAACKPTSAKPHTFLGYRRPDGKVGSRNDIWIIPTVGCVNSVASAIARQANAHVHGSVDEVIAFAHPYGCSQMGDDQENSRKILADLIRHPNAGGVLVLGLGCENSNIDVLKPYIGEYDENRVKFLVAQEWDDEIEAGVDAVLELIDHASGYEREPVGADELIIGLKCGGSDGLSGITANPLVGRFSDMLIACGGTTILTEVLEMFGAETLLMNRCETEELFLQTVDLINDFKNYFMRHGQTIYENPSPGNKKGGISTLEDKSLGCTQKSGSATIKGVLSYGETVKKPGLNLLSAPGNDLVASTALAAAGAHMVLFTTGRGTPFACPVPTMKISSNSALAAKKSNWIDFNAGVLVEGQPMDMVADDFFAYVLAVASGEKLRSEKAGFHDLAIFKQGVTL